MAGMSVPEVVPPGDLGDETTALPRAMRRENVSPDTIATPGTAVDLAGTGDR